MQLLSDRGGLSPLGVADKISPDRPAGAMAGLKGPGFKAILAEQGLSRGEPPATAKGQSLPLAGKGAQAAGGEKLPLQRSTIPTDRMPPEQTVLSDLSEQLNQLTATVEQLLDMEHSGDGALSTWLSDRLGLDEEQVAAVIDALESWVAQPPEVAVDPDQLMAAGPEGLAEVAAVADLLAGLDEALSGWLNALDSPIGDNAQGNAVAGRDPTATAKPLSGEGTVDGLARLLGAEPGGDRAATLIARILQNVQNTAASGSLPMTMDLSRPEAELLLSQEAQPSEKTAFNAALVAMARQSLGGAAPTADSADLGTVLSGLESLSSATTATTAPLTEATLKAADPLALQRLERPLLAAEAGRQLGERIHMMVRGDIQHATIRLDPPELGALDIKVTVQNDQTQVQIVVQSNQVREALESQSARLKEFLEQQGLSLANLDIRDGSAQQRDSEGDSEQHAQAAGDGLDDTEEVSEDGTQRWRPGLVDQFV